MAQDVILIHGGAGWRDDIRTFAGTSMAYEFRRHDDPRSLEKYAQRWPISLLTNTIY
jgi:hypothetical protein